MINRLGDTMTVRMRETRLLVHSLHDMTQLLAGKEYALPKEYAAFLVLEGKADFRPGRLSKFAPKEARCPKRPQRVDPRKVLLLDD